MILRELIKDSHLPKSCLNILLMIGILVDRYFNLQFWRGKIVINYTNKHYDDTY